MSKLQEVLQSKSKTPKRPISNLKIIRWFSESENLHLNSIGGAIVFTLKENKYFLNIYSYLRIVKLEEAAWLLRKASLFFRVLIPALFELAVTAISWLIPFVYRLRE